MKEMCKNRLSTVKKNIVSKIDCIYKNYCKIVYINIFREIVILEMHCKKVKILNLIFFTLKIKIYYSFKRKIMKIYSIVQVTLNYPIYRYTELL